ncbi:prolyl oligopeptidase family serine peptidase [Amycolatopsis rhizosphaerae]|uniref:Prolyl oligopeptidase family serine peptidase n=1 Tax=Amycolatopsis rhizosphaerae TaxID=2053003 RepID=A0A558D0V4_9PSEU|nr:DPP IV N-terminal domain-containing protein [Amycolatopsis rhizosphaerae]TVT54650.1 prolyl oligopeptidase family serine peptidase [Amycolatopsis rhizosphaerae]
MTTARLDATAYQAAERLLRHNRAKLVHGGRIRPCWLPGGDRFWYTVDTAEGARFLFADPAAGIREPAFDHDRLAAALAEASGQPVAAAALPFTAIDLTGDAVEFDAFDAHWRCSLDTYRCEKAESAAGTTFLDIVSPDGKHAVFRRGHDLWIRSLPDGAERPLTTDGAPDHDYGTSAFTPDVLLGKIGIPHLPPAVAWSPDSARLLTHRLDQRAVRTTHLVEALPGDGGAPRLMTQRFAYPGDENLPLAEFVVLDTTGEAVPARSAPLPVPLLSPITAKWAWWAEDGSAVYYLSQSRDMHTLSLHRLDAVTGEVRTVHSETGTTRVEPAQQQNQGPMVRLLAGGRELLWYSQRDGWGHLYRYDLATGELLAQVTSGAWAVQEILHLDEDRGLVYFVAAGLVENDPYRRSVCRSGLDGAGFTRLTDDDLDHVVTVAPGGRYFLDSASTIATPPVIRARDWDGRVLVELERADISRLIAAGWTAPERFRVKAADGETDIYGVLHLPRDFDPARRYPVIDHPYPGPHMRRVPPSFDPGMFGCDAEATAALGFAVIAVDGRGTPGRDKAFHDASFGNLGSAGGLDDHVAALRQLARTRPWLDLDRVGIFGLSGGGYATVRALCRYPEVYKAGVAEAGNHENRNYHLWWSETYDGADPGAWLRSSNVELAGRLEGKLMLVHGGMDDNVHPHQTLRLAERLIEADKDFDLVIVPGAEHTFFGYEHYVTRRRWDFLVRHVLGAEPPEGYRLAPAPFDLNLIADIFG